MIFLRNLVAAPITEELVFRGLLVPILTIGYASIKDASGEHVYTPFSVMIRVPLWFAMAHVHHLIEKIRSGEKLTFVILGTLLQMTYTSIFGCIAAAFLMRTGNIYAPIASHMFCNYWGLPNTDFMSPPSKNRRSDLAFMYPYRYLLLVMHGLGLVLFSAVFIASTDHLTRESVFYNAFRT
jgi:membrane protease YdiL (CAAX protease family)